MAKSPAVHVGHIGCLVCGREGAQVKQIQTRGNRLFLSCECNSCIRLDGPETQTKIWNEAKFLPGVAVKKPSNVIEQAAVEGELVTEKPQQSEAETNPVASQVEGNDTDLAAGDDDFNPDHEPDEPEGQPEKKSGKKGLIALGVMGLAAIGGAILS